jgi:hypothetical protein
MSEKRDHVNKKRNLIILLSVVVILAIVLLIIFGGKRSAADAAETTAATTVEKAPDATEKPTDDDPDDDPDEDPDASDTSVGDGFVRVDTVSGKTAPDLFQSFVNGVQNKHTYDAVLTMTSIADGVEVTITQNVVRGENEFLVVQTTSASNISSQFCFVDGVLYRDYGTTKIKHETNFERAVELSGGLNVDHFLYATDSVDECRDSLADAQLYGKDGEYYYERTLTDAERSYYKMVDNEIATEKIFFDAEGNFIKKIMRVESVDGEVILITITMNSYGDDVSVVAPEDADSYVLIPIT